MYVYKYYVCVYILYVCMQQYVIHVFIVHAQYAGLLHHRDLRFNMHTPK